MLASRRMVSGQNLGAVEINGVPGLLFDFFSAVWYAVCV